MAEGHILDSLASNLGPLLSAGEVQDWRRPVQPNIKTYPR